MAELYAGIAVFTAGFVLFPALLGVINWTANDARRLWVAISAWAVTVSVLGVVQAALFLNIGDVWTLLSIRQLFVGLSSLAMVLFLKQASGWFFPVLTSALAAVIFVRAVLWFTTDLVWERGATTSGAESAGPLRVVFMLLVATILTTILIKSVRRPWVTSISRPLVIAAIVIGLVFAALMSVTSSDVAELLQLLIVAVPVVAIQSMLFTNMRRETRAAEIQSKREGGLAEFGTAALAPGASVPSAHAVQLLARSLEPAVCSYEELIDGSFREVISEGTRPPDSEASELCVPVEVSDRLVGRLRIKAHLTPDDTVFCRSVGITLSAALARIELENSMRDQALHDALTKLPNWMLLQDRLAGMIKRARGRSIAVVCCDIVDMKGINDRFGHDVGDELLRAVGTRMAEKADDGATVARIGSDEFVITQYVADGSVAEELSRSLATMQRFDLGELTGPTVIGIRAGLAISHGERANPDKFVRDAEIALMQAKSAGTPTAIYSSLARDSVDYRRVLAQDLRQAVHDSSISVHYQPIMNLVTNQPVGLEALARWNRNDTEPVSPHVFVPIAEDEGLITAITRQVFDQALRQLSAWSTSGGMWAQLRLSLNLSARVADDDTFVEWLRATLAENSIDPARITIELTESALEGATADLYQRIHELADLGLRISLDDFGTGYSTLTRLIALPVTELKIDKTFVNTSPGPHRDIIRMIVGLAESSHLDVVAEGIETRNQADLVRALGCELGQGYLFATPAPAEHISHLLSDRPRLAAPGAPRTSTESAPVPTTSAAELTNPPSNHRS